MCETMGDASGAARAWQGRPVEDELRVEVERLREALRLGRDALDRLMGGTDLDDDDSVEMRACRAMSAVLEETKGSK